MELLNAGVNDLGGTLMEETISRMAGSDHGVRKEPEDLRAIAAAAGRPAAERTTDYARIEVGEGIEKKQEDFAAEVKAQAEKTA